MGAITVTNLTSGQGQDASGPPFEALTTAVNTVEGRTYFLAIGTDDTTSATAVTVDSISTAGGVTWSLVDRAIADASNGRNLELWKGTCTATSSSVQWTITFANVTANATYAYFIDEAAGSDITGTVVQSVKSENDAASPVTVTLAAFQHAGNATYAVALNDATDGTGTLTKDTGYTDTGSQQNTTSNNITIKGQYLGSSDTTPSFTGSGTSDDYSMIAVEIKSATKARTTQVAVESLSQIDPKARATQIAIEALSQVDPKARATQIAIEALSQVDPKARATQIVVEVLSSVAEVAAQPQIYVMT